jgi:hypothetical protein
MRDRRLILLVHRLGRIRLRATRYGAARTSPYRGVGYAARGGARTAILDSDSD